MKIDILLPTEYITRNRTLAKLSNGTLDSIESKLVSDILCFESGIMKSTIEGYYKSITGIITKSRYKVLTVYTSERNLYNYLFNTDNVSKICKVLKQESIGIIIDNVFYCKS